MERPYEELEMSFIEFWAPFAETCLYVSTPGAFKGKLMILDPQYLV